MDPICITIIFKTFNAPYSTDNIHKTASTRDKTENPYKQNNTAAN